MKTSSREENRKQLEGTFFILVCCTLFNVIFFSNTQVERLYILLSFVILFTIAVNRRLLSTKVFFYVFLICCFSVFLTVIVHRGEGLVIVFLNILLAVLLFCNLQISAKAYRRIHLLIAVVLSLYVATVDFDNRWFSYIYSVLGYYLNVNSLSVLILAAFYSWMCFLSTISCRKLLLWIVRFGIFIGGSYLLYMCSCRTTITAMVVFALLSIAKKEPFSYKQFRRLIVTILILNVIIVPLYISIAEMNDDITILGKPFFSGRQYVWKSAWEHFRNSPLIGNGESVLFYGPNHTATLSAHNTLLNILCTLGVFPAASFVALLGRRLPSTRHYQYNRIAQFAFLSSLFLSFFESFYVDSHFFVFYLILLLPVESEH